MNKQACITKRKLLQGALGASLGVLGVLQSPAAAEKSGDSSRPQSSGGAAGLVRIPDVSIRMRSPDSALVGVSATEVVEISLADVLKFHGYCAGGVAFSFRAAQEAFRTLYGDRLPLRQNLKVQTSFHCCQAGALAYITGARTDFGAIPNRGDLILIPEDRRTILWEDKKTGEKAVLKARFNPHHIFSPLFQRVRKDPASSPEVRKALDQAVQEYIYGPADKLFSEVLKG
jgi:hypothetical protein